MTRPLMPVLAGAGAGLIASVVQAGIGAGENMALLPADENVDLAPRLMARLAARTGRTLSKGEQWSLGTLYHLAYGAGWGALYALARERRRLHPIAGGTLLAGVIYGITFPGFGGAVRLGAERPPPVRSGRMEFVLGSVTLSFGLTTAYACEALRDIP